MRSSTWRMILVLALVSTLSGGVLAGFYSWLNPIIEANRTKADLEVGFKGIFPEAANFEIEVPATSPESDDAIYRVLAADGRLLGYAFKAVGEGFGGPIKMALGITADRSALAGVRVLQMSETPGLGTKIQEPVFTDQFVMKPLTDPYQLNQDIDGITGATISSRAAVEIIRTGIQSAMERMGQPVQMAAASTTEEEAASALPDLPEDPAEALVSMAMAAGFDAAMFMSMGTTPVEGAKTDPEVFVGVTSTGETGAVGFRASADGVEGPVEVLGIIDPGNRTLVSVRVFHQQETPDLGDKIATDAGFQEQFKGMSIESRFEVGDDIDGITGATLSSKAVAEAVRYGIAAARAAGLVE
ncbi:MAG: FMN-binding protein [Limnochordales bacterium]|nr:FMN-binding protein [Limnochordales bacterium]